MRGANTGSSNRPDSCSNTEQNILNYCISGDLKSLKQNSSLLSQAVHKNFTDGQTCLIAACRNGHRDVAKYLIDVCGADVEQVGVVEFESEQVEGVPPLWCAAAAGHLELVELLVSRGADVNRTTITNSTALRAACFDGHEQVVRFLVEHGANVEIPNRHGHTCLMISCYRRHDRIVEYLLSKRARVNRRSAKGNTALHDCAESGNLKSLQMLLEHRAIMRKDEYGQSPIMSGANAAFKKIVDYLASQTDSSRTGTVQTISVQEKAAAYELLGASLFDRHSLAQDAIAAWFQALNLRQEAGVSSKDFVPPKPKCGCNPLVAVDSHVMGEQRMRTAFDESAGSSWSLVNLASREAVAITETVRTHGYSLIPTDPAMLCPSCRLSAMERPNTSLFSSSSQFSNESTSGEKSGNKLYEQKQQQLQRQLFHAYQEQIQRLLSTVNHSGSLTMDLSQTDQKSGGQNSYNTDFRAGGCCLPSSSSDHSLLTSSMSSSSNSPPGLIQPAKPVDPILGIEPICWEAPSYRRWSLDPNCSPTAPAVYSHADVTTPSFWHRRSRRRCFVCKRILMQLGCSATGHQKPNSPSSFNLCSACALTWNVEDLRPSSKHSVMVENESEDSSSCANQVYPTVCACCHLVSEDHPLIRRLRQCGEEAFGHVREFTNSRELTDLMRNAHALRLQPLLIRLRILGPDHPDTIYFIRYRGAIYADVDNFRQCLNLWRYALELQRIFLEPLCHVSQAAFVSFAELFQFVLTNNYAGLPAIDLDPSLIVDCLELAVDNIERGMDYSFYQWYRRHPWSYTTADKEAINLMRHVALCLHFIAMILTHYIPEPRALPANRPLRRQLSYLNIPITTSDDNEGASRPPALLTTTPGRGEDVVNEDHAQVADEASGGLASSDLSPRSTVMHRLISPALRERFLYQVYRLVRLDPRVHHGHSLIHLACSPETSTVGRFIICHFPNLDVLSLLFQLGADPNCVDVHGQRPIGYVLCHRRLQCASQASLITTLLRGGAHLDATNQDGLSALDPKFRHVLAASKLCVLQHRTLACLAATEARRAGFNPHDPYVQNHLTEPLLSFLAMH
ncbi:unnamed protein product [Calicophoron daubneyi]|uniref:Sex-determining protein fem-1 n=1 Tax=Calicophoron daubneyi TaxID=300641 RepID=A0AAV2SVN6_CALDB